MSDLSKFHEAVAIAKEKDFEILGYGPYKRLTDILCYNYGQNCSQFGKNVQDAWDNITRKEIDSCNWYLDETTDSVSMAIAICNYMGFETPFTCPTCCI